VGVSDLLVVLFEFLRHAAVSLELLTEPTGHLFNVAVEIASVLLEAAIEIVLGHAAVGLGLMSGGHHSTVELRPRAAALGPPRIRTTVRQRRKRQLAVRRGPTKTGLEAIELAENLIELLGDVGVRIEGSGSHRRRREWGWDMRRKRRLELGVRLPWMMRSLRRLRRLRRTLHRLHVPGDDPFETFDRVEVEACGPTGALLHLAVRTDLDIKGEHRHLRRQDDRSPLPRSEWPAPARRRPGLLSLIRLRGVMRRSRSPCTPPFRMLEKVDELGDRVVGGSLKPPRGHGPRFRLR